MKQLTCEMCGGTNLVKQDGMFVCQDCGCKYSVEEARKMMIEGTVEIQGTVKVDNSSQISNYMEMAEASYSGKNNEDAENYLNKVIEIEPRHVQALEFKGRVVVWQSSIKKNRLSEGVVCWENALKYASTDDNYSAEEFKGLAKKLYTNLLNVLPAMQNQYLEWGQHETEDSGDVMLNGIANLISTASRFVINCHAIYASSEKGGKEGNPFDLSLKAVMVPGSNFEILAKNYAFNGQRNLREASSRSSGTIYGSETLPIMRLCKLLPIVLWAWLDDTDKEHAYGVLKDTLEKFKKDCGWNWSNIGKYAESGLSVLETEHSKYLAESKKKKEEATRAYWEQHKEEKEALEAEKEQLETEIAEYDSHVNELPEMVTLNNLKEQIKKLESDKNALGLFKGKEKKALQERIDALTKDAVDAKKIVEEVMAPNKAKKERISEIITELTKER